MCQHLSVAGVAEAWAVSWDTANDAVLGEGQRVLIAEPYPVARGPGDRRRRTLLGVTPAAGTSSSP